MDKTAHDENKFYCSLQQHESDKNGKNVEWSRASPLPPYQIVVYGRDGDMKWWCLYLQNFLMGAQKDDEVLFTFVLSTPSYSSFTYQHKPTNQHFIIWLASI